MSRSSSISYSGFKHPLQSLPLAHIGLALLLLACMSLFLACEKKNSSVIDSLGAAPLIVNASISPASVNIDTIPATVTTFQLTAIARVSHPDGLNQISEVNVTVTDGRSTGILASGILNDNGVSPDRIAGDSVFSGQISVPHQNLQVGTYYCQISAHDPHGYTSSNFLLPFAITRINLPPVISNLQAPDTIKLAGQTQQFKLTVKVTDPNGQADILRVSFNSYKPNGTASSGNPFLMYDDGSENILFPPNFRSGDAVKGDSIYTLTVIINPTDSQGNPTALGGYPFEFQAVDRSNASSDTLRHTIYVVQ